MFKTAATKLAHNSTIPSLSGNTELRPLQDLITAEKAVLISLQKLSVDFSKAAEALRTWGLSEGDDLGDILGGSTTILNHFSSALTQYAAHGHAIREQLKTIRSREENLDELKRRRRNVFRKADEAEKKLSKMSPEHKNLQTQADLLNRLRDEIRSMDTNVIVEEAALGDFKRTATKMWMGLKFCGLMECCEKGSIAATFGRKIISDISEEQTQPGRHRPLYQGRTNTESLVAEAHRAVNEVSLSTVPSTGFRDRRQYYGGGVNSNSNALTDTKPMPSVPRDSSELPPPQRQSSSDSPSPITQRPQPWSGSVERRLSVDRFSAEDFGVKRHSDTEPIYEKGAAGGRFATFPVKGRSSAADGFSLLDPLPMQSRHDLGPSFASSIVEALDHTDNPFIDDNALSISSSLLEPPSRADAKITSADADGDTAADSGEHRRNLSDNDAALLAYMISADEDLGLDSPPRNSFQSSKSAAPPAENGQRTKQDRYGEVSDVDEESEKRGSLGEEKTIANSISDVSHETVHGLSKSNSGTSTLYTIDEPSKPPTEHYPTSSPEEQEKKLNAAAAREISRELEILNSSQKDLFKRPLSVEASIERGRMAAGTTITHDGHSDDSRDPSPLAPPSAPFARRSVSPHPLSEKITIPSRQFPIVGQHTVGPSPYTPTYGQIPSPLHSPKSISPRTHYLSQTQEPEGPPRLRSISRHSSYQIPQIQGSSSAVNSSSTVDLWSLSSNKPVSPFTSSSSGISPAPGTKTISAAAFKRPRNRSASTDNLGNPEIRGFPASPHPLPSPWAGGSNISPEENRFSQSGFEYDYVDAYMSSSTPSKTEFDVHSTQRESFANKGYGTGKFSTDLEDNLLR